MAANDSRHFTAALGQRFDHLYLLDGHVKPEKIEVEYPPIERYPGSGAPMPIYSRLAREHPWDIGEQAFSTYLIARDLGKLQVALPVFPSRFFPHTSFWVPRESDISNPQDLVGRRVACGSFAINYAVCCRGLLTHQYDVPIQRITWVESVEEHLVEFRPPRRFAVERLPGEVESVAVLAEGGADAATIPGSGAGADRDRVRPLFADPYPEIGQYVEANRIFPINTVITVRQDAVARNPEMPRLMFDAFVKVKGLYDAAIAEGHQDVHMGLSLKRLREVAGVGLPAYGFQANRDAIRVAIAYSYEQGIIRNLFEPEDLFLLTDS